MIRPSRCHGEAGGFSLVELLIATAIVALLAGVIAGVVPTLQAYFEQTPAAIDVYQRGRTAVDAIARAVRSADRIIVVDAGRLLTIAPRAEGGRGVVERDQPDAGDDLVLSSVRCPAAADVCGFVRGGTAVIEDGSARFDLFTIGSVDPAARSLSPRHRFDRPYGVHASVVEVDAYTFRLDPQVDGSNTLVRETSAGAVQPIVDRVATVRFAEALDARGIDVTMTLQTHGPRAAAITRRIAIMARNVP